MGIAATATHTHLEAQTFLTGPASPVILTSPASPMASLPSVDSGYSVSSDFSPVSDMVTTVGEDFGSVEEIDQFLDTFHLNIGKDMSGIPTEGGVKIPMEREDTDMLDYLFLET